MSDELLANRGRSPVTDYDHHSPGYAREAGAINAQLRTESPVAWSEHYGGFWVLSRYEDVATASRDDATFSSEHNLLEPGLDGVAIPPPPVQMIPLEVDPPRFQLYRRLLNPKLTATAIDGWEAFIEDLVTALLDRVLPLGEADLVLDVAVPLPAIVTLAILGLPLDDWYRYAEPMHTVVYSPPGSAEHERATVDQFWIVQQLIEAIIDRTVNPRDDLLTHLAQGTLENGEAVSPDDAVSMAYTVMAGGVDTTTALISNSLVWLAQHTEERQRLIHNPDALPLAREEFLRFFAPVQGFARTVTENVSVGGCPMSQGDRVFLSWASANRDADVFASPESVLLDRFPNRHTSFGLGIHRCIGSHLARREFDIVVREVLQRMPDFHVDPDKVERYESIGNINGIVRCPIAFTPGEVRGSPLAPIVASLPR
jgi:cytochrome P450